MNVLPLPARNATAGAWGAVAVSIPGWCWPVPVIPFYGPEKGTDVTLMLPALYALPEGGDFYSVTWGAGYHGHWSPVPDVNHWAWVGWFLKLVGNLDKADQLAHKLAAEDGIHITPSDDVIASIVTADPSKIIRQCITVAHTLGRWPGGAP